MARSWGIQPGEFWDMTLSEWFCEYRHNKPKGQEGYAGRLTQSDVDDLMEWIENG
jgi:hypothetical protein